VLVGTPFHQRTALLNRKMQWREWSGYYAASMYADGPEIEYNAIREAAALIDVSPLYKYLVSGPDAPRFVDRVQVRSGAKLAVNQVFYTCWCDEEGKVVDDGTITRLDETTYRWTAADQSLRWFRLNSSGLDVDIQEITETMAAVALQGPRSRDVLESATAEQWGELKYFRRRPSQVEDIPVDVTRTGYTGDLGYELWVDAERAVSLWDALTLHGGPYGIRPAGMLALDVVRVEAGLILLEVDYTGVRAALIPEQAFSPFELGILGQLVKFDKADFVGKRALEAEQRAGGPPRRLVGLEIEWDGIEKLYSSVGLPPTMAAMTSRTAVPIYDGRRQVGKATSTTWSPTLKQAIALASVQSRYAEPGTRLSVEWTVEARRRQVPAIVAKLPFFDPPRKRA
jgi:aminomethyltransferase